MILRLIHWNKFQLIGSIRQNVQYNFLQLIKINICLLKIYIRKKNFSDNSYTEYGRLIFSVNLLILGNN
jgi:hypothetical protein